MAWSISYPAGNTVVGPSQGSFDATTTWNTRRAMLGNVQMKLDDVSFLDGRGWNYCLMTVYLIDDTGRSRGSATLRRDWGQATSFVNVGRVSPGAAIRLRTHLVCYGPGGTVGQQNWASFNSTIRWDNSTAS